MLFIQTSATSWILNFMSDWDLRFLKLAKEISTWSKDPSTKTGAVLVGLDNNIVATGYNGFPRIIKDTPELLNNREEKLKRIIHCEMNALLHAPFGINECTLYTWPDMSCARCATHMIQAGVWRVVYPVFNGEHLMAERWAKDFEVSKELFDEAGVIIEEYPAIQEWYLNA